MQEVLSQALKIAVEGLKVSRTQGLQRGLQRRLPLGQEVCLEICLQKTAADQAVLQGPAWPITRRHERCLELNYDGEC